MMLRPGLGYIGATKDNAAAVFLPFVFSSDQTALLELTDSAMRVWVSEAVVTRSAVSALVSNGLFNTDLVGWTDADDTGATSQFGTGGYMSLTGTRYSAARRRQEVTVT